MSMTFEKTSIFPADAAAIWERLQNLSSLQSVAAPLMAFETMNGTKDLVWKCSEPFVFKIRLFGRIPLGVHTIRILTFDPETLSIYSNEHNTFVPVWNHRIELLPIDDGHTRYTDRVEIEAGWKTPFIYLWAGMFYAHRQRRWRKLLRRRTPQ